MDTVEIDRTTTGTSAGSVTVGRLSWKLTVRSSGDRSENRELDIHTKFLGSYHDGYIEFHYRNVRDYLLPFGGDWMYGEVRLGEEGHVIHEIRFLADSHWLIECDDFTYEWKPMEE